jgi:hypothetical protein
MNPTILAQADQEMTPAQASRRHRLEAVRPTIAHMNPTSARGHRANALNTAGPNRRFSLPALLPLGACLVIGCGLTEERLLVDQPEQLTGLGIDGQTVVLEKSSTPTVANRSELVGNSSVRGEIVFSAVVDDQHGAVAFHTLASALPMDRLKRVVRDAVVVDQTIGSFEFGPVQPLG